MLVTLHGMKNGFRVNVMSVVNANMYLGICLSTRLSFTHAMKDRVKIGVVNILKLLPRK